MFFYLKKVNNLGDCGLNHANDHHLTRITTIENCRYKLRLECPHTPFGILSQQNEY